MGDERIDTGTPAPGTVVTGAAYGALFMLGVIYGILASLWHAWDIAGLVPPVPIFLSFALFALLYGMGRLMRTKLGAFVPGMGWMLVALLFSVKRAEGDLIIAANGSGYWYLGGGALAMVVAVLLIPSNGSWLLRQGPYGGSQRLNISGGMSA